MSSKEKNLSDYSLRVFSGISKLNIAVVVSEWNPEITEKLFDGTKRTLLENGVKEKNIIRINVPGSFELPLGAQFLLQKNNKGILPLKNVDAVICLGCVIQGETRHFDFICTAVAKGIIDVSLKFNKPVVFGVLTTNNVQQARARAGGRHGNKGVEAAITAIKMLRLKAGN